MLLIKTFRGFAVSSLAALNSLPHAIDSSFHAEETQHNIDRLALNAGHESIYLYHDAIE